MGPNRLVTAAPESARARLIAHARARGYAHLSKVTGIPESTIRTHAEGIHVPRLDARAAYADADIAALDMPWG